MRYYKLHQTNSQAVHQNAVVVLATSQTAATGMLAVLADAAMAHERVTTLMASLLQVRRHVPARIIDGTRQGISERGVDKQGSLVEQLGLTSRTREINDKADNRFKLNETALTVLHQHWAMRG